MSSQYVLFMPFAEASLVAQLVKSLLAMRETWVRSLSWEDPLEEGKAAHSSAPWEALAGYFENIFMF